MSLPAFSEVSRTWSTKQIPYTWISPTRGVSESSPLFPSLSYIFKAITTFFERTKVPQSKSSQISITISTQHQASTHFAAQSTKYGASETAISWT